MKPIPQFGRALSGAVAIAVLVLAPARGEVLLDEKWHEGSRTETSRPQQAAVWVGRTADVTVEPGALTTAMTPASQKIWTYFTDDEPITLAVGQKLAVSVSFVPRKELSKSSSRSLRIGLFHDPTDPRVEQDVNSDGGGSDLPWRDAQGYAVQVLVTADEYTGTRPFDLGKRVNLESPSLLGSSGDYAKVSGGELVVLQPETEYTVTLSVERKPDDVVELTATYQQGDETLSTWSVTDDRSYLGTGEVYDTFDMLFIRITDRDTTADQIEFTNFKVELAAADSNP